MPSFQLHISCPSRVFDACWYGVGEIVSQVPVGTDTAYVVDYGDDQYRAQYQADRFASGLYFAQVEVAEVG